MQIYFKNLRELHATTVHADNLWESFEEYVRE